MKKLLSLITILCLCLSLAACGQSSDGPEATEAQTAAPTETMPEATFAPMVFTSKPLAPIRKDVTLEPTLLWDQDGVTITATGLEFSSYDAKLTLEIQNGSGKNLEFYAGTMGYSRNSINGYMLLDGYLNCEAAAGETVTDSVSISYLWLRTLGIAEIADLEIGIEIVDEDYNRTYTGPLPIHTSAFSGYDYSTDTYQQAIVNPLALQNYEAVPLFFDDKIQFDQAGVKALSLALLKNRDGKPLVILEVENTNDYSLRAAVSDITRNGLLLRGGDSLRAVVSPGKRALLAVDLSSLAEEDVLQAYGLGELQSLGLSLRITDEDLYDLTAAQPLTLQLSQSSEQPEPTGTEVFSSEQFQILNAGIVPSPSKDSRDYLLCLWVHNTGVEPLSLNIFHDTVSLNGHPCEYWSNPAEIPAGQWGIFPVRLQSKALDRMGIQSPEDITALKLDLQGELGEEDLERFTVHIIQ